ncbi:MAG: GHMP kinase [Cyanobacteriota bacterium]|nr:GHMP kinase [Cyanobacteriota bacterium]
MKLFVPGRLCLFGEHSDWAAKYRCSNPSLGKGYALIAGLNLGLYARVKPHPTRLLLRATGNGGAQIGTIELPMEPEKLLTVARKGGFFSYAAGVTYQIQQRYPVGGLEIDNYRTDLPIQKGLSSSAALCVLVARAFNYSYNLKLTIREEMELAYLGEIVTPSKCGRMDQACAYGNRLVMMIFDGEHIEIVELSLRCELFFVIVDLGGYKNTSKILAALNEAYPVASNERQKGVQYYLGVASAEITRSAAIALERGEAKELGELMRKAQGALDRYLQPACPSQLTAPLLHALLSHPPLQPHLWGGKGVGSQGDGTAQLLVKDRQGQATAIAILQRDFPQMRGFELTLKPKLLS